MVPEGSAEEDSNRLQQHVYDRIMAEGRRSIAVTELDGRKMLRLVAISPAVTFEALEETIFEVRKVASAWMA